jgi:hypothetical protein
MKYRPVLLVVLLLTGFYLVTTHLASTGVLAPWLAAMHASGSATSIESLRGQDGAFDLNVASAAPSFDAEEQQRGQHYNHRSGMGFLLRASAAVGAGIGFYPQQGRADPDQ